LVSQEAAEAKDDEKNNKRKPMKTTKYTSANDPLLDPENHAVLLIDHQYLQLLTVRSHDGAN
jgi:hypothetical protein